ncbi:MAG: nuclear transport factor 2 family protein [Pseudomonadota bacterium]
MVKVTGSRDCGNSPKNTFAQTIGVALESGEFLGDVFSEDIVWQQPDIEIEGSEAVQRALAAIKAPTSIVVEHAITHGKVGATSGFCTMPGGQKRRFSHVIEFTNTKAKKVAKLKTYA